MAEKPKITLDDVETAIDSSQDYMFMSYANTKTGEIVMLSEEDRRVLEEDEEEDESEEHEDGDDDSERELPEWQVEQRELIRRMQENREDYVPMPTSFDFHEYRVMERFCYSVENEALADKLLHSIKGRGAFRMFKTTLFAHHIENDWYEFRQRALREVAQQWCDDFGFELVDRIPPPEDEKK